MKGKVWLLNVWGSWCVSCRQEHPVLVEFSKNANVPLVGLNYKEVRGDGNFDMSKMPADEEKKLAFQRANQWLAQHGKRYTHLCRWFGVTVVKANTKATTAAAKKR